MVDDEDMPNLYEEYYYMNLVSKDWKWECGEEVGDDEEIQGPPEADNYNYPHGLKYGIANIFGTVLQLTFKCNVMNQYFQRISTQINRNKIRYVVASNSTLYYGHKWTNITIG